MADVSVVIVTLDGLPWVAPCIESVLGAAREVILVDHGSSDGTVALVRERFPAVRVIEQGNVGYGAGMNAGMRVAAGAWFLVLNADAWAERGGGAAIWERIGRCHLGTGWRRARRMATGPPEGNPQ